MNKYTQLLEALKVEQDAAKREFLLMEIQSMEAAIDEKGWFSPASRTSMVKWMKSFPKWEHTIFDLCNVSEMRTLCYTFAYSEI